MKSKMNEIKFPVSGGFHMVWLGVKYIFSGKENRKEIEKRFFKAFSLRVLTMPNADRKECLGYLAKVKSWKLETL